MSIPTLLRAAEHAALKTIELNGSILDLGGDARSDYRSLIKGDHTFTTVNLDEKAVPDISHDLEKPLPLKDDSYDHALLINVLEHIYEYRQLLRETVRVTRPNGTIVMVVPFLFPIHPSPSDFWRFTQATLEKECADAGLFMVRATSLGTGVFAARYVLLDWYMPAPIRFLRTIFVRPFVYLLDTCFAKIATVLGKKYRPSDYPLGYVVEAKKG